MCIKNLNGITLEGRYMVYHRVAGYLRENVTDQGMRMYVTLHIYAWPKIIMTTINGQPKVNIQRHCIPYRSIFYRNKLDQLYAIQNRRLKNRKDAVEMERHTSEQDQNGTCPGLKGKNRVTLLSPKEGPHLSNNETTYQCGNTSDFSKNFSKI